MLGTITIHAPDNHLYTFSVHVWSEDHAFSERPNECCTVRDLKFLLEVESKLPHDLMRFLYKGWELTDTVILTDQIQRLTCIIRPRVCSIHTCPVHNCTQESKHKHDRTTTLSSASCCHNQYMSSLV